MSEQSSVERIEAQLREIRREIRESRSPHIVPAAVNITDAAVMLGVSPKHVSRMIRRGELQPRDVGGARRIPVSQIHALLEAPTMKSAAAPVVTKTPRYDAAAASRELAALRKKP